MFEDLEVKRTKCSKKKKREKGKKTKSASPRREMCWRLTTGNRGEDHRGE